MSNLFKFCLCITFLLYAGVSSAQSIQISGSVQNQEGTPLIGASVIARGTNAGAITDEEGHFQLNLNGQTTLHISQLGYQPKDSVVSESNHNLIITLKQSTQTLD